MRYRVVALRSRTLCKLWGTPELYDKPMILGPYKRLKYAKKIRAVWAKDRVMVAPFPGSPFVDLGPTCRSVKIEEVPDNA